MTSLLTMFQAAFIYNAFLAGALIATTAAVIGYFVVLRAEAFAAHGLAHIAFAGATGAALLGLAALPGTLIFTIAAALAMGGLGRRLRGRDVVIGLVLSFALGLGVLFLKLYTNAANEAVGLLFGSILSVTTSQIHLAVWLALGVLAVVGFLFRPLLFASIDPEGAEARGVPVKALSIVFLLLLAITVAQAVQVVGILLVFALIIAPPAIAQHIFRRPAAVIGLSILLGVAFTWGGLLLAMLTPYPVSFYIAALAGASYLLAVNLSHFIHPHRHHEPAHPDHEHVDHPHHQHAHP